MKFLRENMFWEYFSKLFSCAELGDAAYELSSQQLNKMRL